MYKSLLDTVQKIEDKIYVTVSKENITKDKDANGEFDLLQDIDNAFEKNGFPKPKRFVTEKKIIDVIDDIAELKPRLILNNFEYIADKNVKKINMCNLFDLFGIAYTGNDSFASIVSLDKSLSKDIMDGNDIPTPDFWEFRKKENWKKNDAIKFPVIVKPANNGGSTGIDKSSVVKNKKELEDKVSEIFDKKIDDIAVAEQFIDGREFSVGVIGDIETRTLPIIEVDFSKVKDGVNIETSSAKWQRGTEDYKTIDELVAKDVPEKVGKEIQEIAKKAYRIFRCRDYIRVDFRVDKSGNPFVIDVNANPDFSSTSGFGMALKSDGIGIDGFLMFLMNSALKRKGLI